MGPLPSLHLTPPSAISDQSTLHFPFPPSPSSSLCVDKRLKTVSPHPLSLHWSHPTPNKTRDILCINMYQLWIHYPSLPLPLQLYILSLPHVTYHLKDSFTLLTFVKFFINYRKFSSRSGRWNGFLLHTKQMSRSIWTWNHLSTTPLRTDLET